MVVGSKCFVWLGMIFGWSFGIWNCYVGCGCKVCGFVVGFAGFPTQSLGGFSILGCKCWNVDHMVAFVDFPHS